MPARPRKARRFGGDAAHQRLMMANLVASLVAAEGLVTTEAKAKALRPVAEKVITKAKRAAVDPEQRLHQIRQVQSYLGDREMTAKLFDEIGPRYVDRNGGYTRILKLGPRHGDNAPMARIELV
ncbi:MAG TPA: 50S ribosomal protein L17 [Acidimicrobiales bacterium]|jgi:large subunit ribosomal protein L17|nr:50S ribosomal protein L17 [Acidimicrobiales bacterium]